MNPYTKILVGTDFSRCSATALREALRLGQAMGAFVTAIHVIDEALVTQVAEAVGRDRASIATDLVGDAQNAWQEFSKSVPGAESVPFRATVAPRVNGLLNATQDSGADLIVLGAYGDREPEVGFGTVATACVRRALCDVLLVRDTQLGGFRRVVVGTDFSPTSAHAIDRAATLARVEGAALSVLHVFDAPWKKLHYRAPTPMVDPKEQAAYRAALEARVAQFAARASDAGASATPVCHDDDGHRSGIAAYASSVGADLIVLGTRGGTNLRDVLLGSTAEKALAESRSSVLAVRAVE